VLYPSLQLLVVLELRFIFDSPLQPWSEWSLSIHRGSSIESESQVSSLKSRVSILKAAKSLEKAIFNWLSAVNHKML